jgi:hypothetical protein
MNDKSTRIDETTFDRLVDGRLADEDRRHLLSALDDRPGGWRACALAFLEAQAWRADLGALASERTPAASVVRQPIDIAGAAAPDNRSAVPSTMHWLALAACVLVAFGLGTLWQENGTSPIVTTGAAPPSETQLASDDAQPQSIPPEPESSDALTLWVRDHTGRAQRLHVPLVDAGAVDQQLGVRFRSGVPDSLRSQLRERGYDVFSTRRYAPLVLENGGSLVVPVEDTRIVPVSSDVY